MSENHSRFYRGDLKWRMATYWLALALVFGGAIITRENPANLLPFVFITTIVLLSNVFTERCLNCGWYVWRAKPGSEMWRSIFRWPSHCWNCQSRDFVNAPAKKECND